MSIPSLPLSDNPSPAFLSRRALAERWDTSPARLATLAHRGGGPAFVKIGERVLYPLAGVEAYEAANLVQPGTE